MAKIQQYKADAVSGLKEWFGQSEDFFFADYRGLTVEQISELRGKLRDLGAEIKVVKNAFAKIAFKEMGNEGLADYFVGPTAVTISTKEAGPVAKALLEFEKDSPIAVKGGLVGGNVFDPQEVEAYSKLPTRDELISMLMSTMQAPVRNVMLVLNGVTTKLVRTLQAVADKKAAE
jgi:large subunit ribosomal protein L10